MIYFGADYYPEQWPEARWPIDADMMAEAGFNVVRLAEFAWTKMEPEPGRYDFSWLDRVIAVLAKRGIQVVLGTPTAAPPAWLMRLDETMYRKMADGRYHTYGNRRDYCPNHMTYQEYSNRIVNALASHYANNDQLAGWQIDNEFGDPCYCDICKRTFQEWLQAKYGTLDELNARWGTVAWSHTYSDWSQIPLPMEAIVLSSPSLGLDFNRFTSDSYVAYQQQQIDILRKHCPDVLITHNFMEFSYDQLNYFDLARPLDFVSLDLYPRGFWSPQLQANPPDNGLDYDMTRGLKQRPFWMMEQQSGPSGAHYIGETPRPGEIRLWAYQAIAHGADAIIFFRWRTSRFGVEQYWHGILDHPGAANRRYQEVAKMGTELRKLGDVAGSMPAAQTALIVSYDSRFAFKIQPHNQAFDYKKHGRHIYAPLHRRQVAVDVVEPMTDLSAYKLVIAPALYILPADVAENLRQYVADGGTLLLTPRAGVKDDANVVVKAPLPGLLAELVGATVAEYDSPAPQMENHVAFDAPNLTGAAPTQGWCDILELDTAVSIAHYTQDYYAEQPAITLNEYGKGKVVYAGTFGNESLYEALADWLLELAGIRPLLNVPAPIEAVQRGDILFLLNHTTNTQTVTLPAPMKNLLTNEPLSGEIEICPKDVLIIKRSA